MSDQDWLAKLKVGDKVLILGGRPKNNAAHTGVIAGIRRDRIGAYVIRDGYKAKVFYNFDQLTSLPKEPSE